MKKRYLYLLLFGIPGFFVSAIISFLVFGAAAGVFWIYLFGDDQWPAAGKKLEKSQGVNKKHILVSIGVTIAPILFMIFRQFSGGNIGPKSDSMRCSDFCAQKGYSGDGCIRSFS